MSECVLKTLACRDLRVGPSRGGGESFLLTLGVFLLTVERLCLQSFDYAHKTPHLK